MRKSGLPGSTRAGRRASTQLLAAPVQELVSERSGAVPDSVSLEEACAVTVEALARALELHDYRRGRFAETEAHGVRVTGLALRLAEAVAPELASDVRLAHGFRLHDIGMIGVSDSIFQKRAKLSPDEIDEIHEHPLLGERIVAPISYLGGICRQVIGAHHEHWDGSGYPRRLEGERIPLAARIFALADSYDLMTTDQPYRRALPLGIVLDEIEQQAGGHFDPDLVPVFLELVQDRFEARTPTRV
jgi:HD-GYP domain-containing protein (c-di-GMP phosphodiesterase class II)